MDTRPYLAFVGTYTRGESDGVYSYQFDADAGDLTELGATAVGDNPTFLDVHPNGEYLYAINEVDGGSVTACAIDRDEGALAVLNRQSSGGDGPCHCSVDAVGEWILVANYAGGSVSMLPIEDDDRVGEPVDVVEHEGSSVDPDRQTEPHPHSITPDPSNRFAYVPDLGTDEIVVYEIDTDRGRLVPVDAVEVRDGAGPRHLDFHPDEEIAYLINELDSTITAFKCDTQTGALEELETVSTLPDDFEGENYPADVHVHPTGQWVYGSNRGHDSIAAFDVRNERGRLAPIGHTPTGGEWPRNFAIDPTGTFLFAENEHTSDVFVFRIDDDGTLEPTGSSVDVPEPVCLRFLA